MFDLFGFLLTLFAGFLFGCLIMRWAYKKTYELFYSVNWQKIIEHSNKWFFLKTAIENLMEDSKGVAGLHHNGEVADWEWLMDNNWINPEFLED